MPKQLKYILITALLTILLAFAAKSSKAQERLPLTISPARQQINVNPGESYNVSLKLINESQIPLTGTLKAVDFIVTGRDGTPILLEGDDKPLSNQFSASSWINLPFEKANIAANDVLKLNLKVNVPDDANPGGKYTAIYYETLGPTDTGSDSTSQFSAVSSRVVSLISFRVSGEVNESAFITTLNVPQFLEFGPVNVSFDIFNKGDLHITPTGQVSLKSWTGKEIDRQTLEQKNVFPDARRTYEAKLGNTWMFGKYKVEALAAYGESGQTAVASAFVWVVPVTLLVILILSLIILVMAATFVYKKVTEKQKTLERKLEMEIDELESLKNKFKDKVSK